ncbi:uncharacterized protein LOC143356314 [Halictus rubicundus]|uniref:uncharacterized protein LOC143356314 n=1 Tax=Halictus rubicundus TaxID=77578 RepID=UPI004036E9E4
MCITDKTESYSPHKEVVKQLSSTVIHKMIINRHFAVVVCFCFLACIYANVTTPGLRTTIEDMIWPLHTIKLRLYYRNYTYTEVSIINATQLLSHMNLTQKTLMHCHGYNNTLDTPFVVDTIYGTYLSTV